MATQVTNYQCPACTGPLRFDGASGMVVCDYCGNSYDTAEIERYYAEKDNLARENFDREPAVAEDDAPWDTSELKSDWGEDAGKMKSYDCPSCGAQLICDETTSATSCPYCGNPSIVPGQFKGAMKPDYIIPFRLSKKDAVSALERYYSGKKFLPDAFTQDNRVEEVQGVYVPFWLFDGEVDADVLFDATRLRTYRQGDYRITETHHYDVRRRGTVPFSRVPVDGSSKMPDTHMDAVEPFDYAELKPFSTAYLPGFLAERYDQTVEQAAPRADRRAKNTAIDLMKSDVVGYTGCVVNGSL